MESKPKPKFKFGDIVQMYYILTDEVREAKIRGWRPDANRTSFIYDITIDGHRSSCHQDCIACD